MIETVGGTPVVMNIVGEVDVAAGVLGRIDTVLPLSARGDGVSVVMKMAVEDLVVIAPHRDAPCRPVLDLKSIEDVVISINEKADIPTRGILAINDRRSRSL